jgi:hypothetical protein
VHLLDELVVGQAGEIEFLLVGHACGPSLVARVAAGEGTLHRSRIEFCTEGFHDVEQFRMMERMVPAA